MTSDLLKPYKHRDVYIICKPLCIAVHSRTLGYKIVYPVPVSLNDIIAITLILFSALGSINNYDFTIKPGYNYN